MPPTIRPATVDAVPLILRFIRALAAYEKLAHEVEATEERLHATLFPAAPSPSSPQPIPAARCVLAFCEDVPAGFAIYFPNYSTFLARAGLHLEDLFVQPEFRGRGAGRALLLPVARLAPTLGCGRMEWTVLGWNEPAKGFYRSLGAIELTDWRLMRLTGPALTHCAR